MLGGLEPGLGDVDRHHVRRSEESSDLDGREANRSTADHDDRVGWGDVDRWVLSAAEHSHSTSDTKEAGSALR